MVVMRTAWVLAMLAVTVLALLPVEHLKLPVFEVDPKVRTDLMAV